MVFLVLTRKMVFPFLDLILKALDGKQNIFGTFDKNGISFSNKYDITLLSNDFIPKKNALKR